MKKYKGVIFDLDGTLLNTLEDITDAVNHTMVAFGLKTWTIEEIRGFVGNGMGRLMELCVPDGAQNAEFEVILKSFLTYYQSHSDVKTHPYADVETLLEGLKAQGLAMAIASNKGDAAVKVLNAKFFDPWIKIARGDMAGQRRKPAPDMVEACLQTMGLKASEVVYIGDSEVDIQTAEHAGIDCISVTWGFRDLGWLQAHGAKHLAHDPEDLYRMITGQ